MYKLDIELNENADGKFFNDWLRTNHEFSAICYCAEGVTIHFQSEPSTTIKNIIIVKYESLTAADLLHNQIVQALYLERETDGKLFFDEFRADLVLEYGDGGITLAQANYIEVKLLNIKSMLLTGEWMSAQYEMDNHVVVNGTVSAEDITNEYTQVRHDEVKAIIDNYVTTNYV